MGRRPILVFTDLDGCLLDHEDYSYESARPALERIRQLAVPLVFVTSKTRSEIVRLQAEMEVREHFISENGGGVFFPAGYRGFSIRGAAKQGGHTRILLGRAYPEIRRFVEQRKGRFGIRGAGDLSVEDLAEITGLTPEEARLAKQREFTEPFLLADGAQLAALREEARAAGLEITRGGRFHHLIGSGQDKGEAVKRTLRIFHDNLGEELLSVGIGDRPNDVPMLAAVDIPVLIPHPDGRYEDVDLPNLMKAPCPGSRGWNEAVRDILERFGNGRGKPGKEKNGS